MKKDSQNNKYDNGLTVTIPTSGRDALLQRVLSSLASQTYNGKFEVIIADNSGTSQINNWLKSNRGRLGYPIEYLKANEISGPSYARNAGAQIARYKYIVFLDDDAVPYDDFLETVKDFFDSHPNVSVLAGRMEALKLEHALEFSRQYLYDQRHRRYTSFEMTEEIAKDHGFPIPTDYFLADFFTGANCACRTNLFIQLNGFDNSILHGQDHEFAARCLQQREQIAYLSSMRVRHNHGTSYKRFFSQTFQHGRSTTQRILKFKTNVGYLQEVNRQCQALLHSGVEWMASFTEKTDAHVRSSLFIMTIAKLLHLAGVIHYGFTYLKKTQVSND